MLQTRNGKRTGAGGGEDRLRHGQGKADRREDGRAAHSGRRSHAAAAAELRARRPRSRPKTCCTVGLPASPGAAVGKLAFTAAEAVERTQAGETVLLVRKETNPEDIEGMHSAVGILTSTGGMTSHAAVVARGWGRCCVAGAGEITIDEKGRKIKVGGKTFTHKDTLSIDGSTGEVMAGSVATQTPKLSGDFATVMEWADKYRTHEGPHERRHAGRRQAGPRVRCPGHRPVPHRAHVLRGRPHQGDAGDDPGHDRRRIAGSALKKLLPLQRKDFIGIFTAMNGLPVTIRLLDPPLHEFLPHEPKRQAEMAKELGVTPADVKARVDQLHEMNPMLGHRGCRLAVTYPEILEMQVTAITEAVIACKQKKVDAMAEIMIPLVGTAKELDLARRPGPRDDRRRARKRRSTRASSASSSAR